MREPGTIPWNTAAIEDPVVRDILDVIVPRVLIGLQPDGSTNRDIKADVNLQGLDDFVQASELAGIIDHRTLDGDTSRWALLGTSPTLASQTAFAACAATFDGRYWLAIRQTGGSEGELKIFKIGGDGLVDSGAVGTITSTKLHTPTSQSIVVHPGSNFVAVITADSGDSGNKYLQIVDITDKENPTLRGRLKLTGVSTVPAAGMEVLWDAARQVIYWPTGDQTAHIYTFDVSDLDAPTLASTYTTSQLTSCTGCTLSPSRDYLYIAGNAGVESAKIAADGTLTQDTKITTGSVGSVAHNGTRVIALRNINTIVVDYYTIDIGSTDDGDISLNTSGNVSGAYTNAGKITNISYIGDYVAFVSVRSGGSAGLFLVFNVEDPTAVTEESRASISGLGSSFEYGMGGPQTRRYIQLHLDAKVDTWGVVGEERSVALTATILVATTLEKPPIEVNNSMLVEKLNVEFLDGFVASDFEEVGDAVLRDGSLNLTANWDAGSFKITAETFESDVPTGTAPLVVASTTKVANLNSDLLDDQTGTYYLDSANFTGTNWTDLTDAGATALHKHDHGGADGLGDDDHTIYSLASGTRDFSGVVIGVAPTLDLHLSTKKYVDDTVGGNLKADGSVPLTAPWDAGAFEIRALTFQSDVATGTPPLIVASTTKVANLDADTVDGLEGASFVQTSVTLTAGVGLSGGGDLTTNRTFTVDLNELGIETTIASDDFIPMVDITDSGSQKITFANLEAALDHDALLNFATNEHFTVASIDHGSTGGLTDDDHIQYSLVDGTRAFTGVVAGVTPLAGADLATKKYGDDAGVVLMAQSWMGM